MRPRESLSDDGFAAVAVAVADVAADDAGAAVVRAAVAAAVDVADVAGVGWEEEGVGMAELVG